MSNLTDLYARDHQCAEVSKLNEVINMFAAEVSVMRNARKSLASLRTDQKWNRSCLKESSDGKWP
ncbi:hypothetical protein BLA27_23490 [Brucella cytisi]|uniref:Uncharacterized protein n=1 Tax=Brucella cytisi TaxID=407152 RepID=A0A1J6HD84_9HYPH|nr:hypothetical protein BLA27_23490 [Brucella cytisi]